MKTLTFHTDYIRSLMRDKDVYDYSLDEQVTIKERINQAAALLNSANFEVGTPHMRRRGDSFTCHPARWEDKIYLRHVSQRIRLIYKILPSQRNSLVKQIKNLLQADAPLTILRTDVKSFYQTISVDSILGRLDRDGFLRSQEMRAVTRLLRPASPGTSRGLPWGLSISSTLAELAMLDFDKNVWNVDGLFYYGRFVDDIIAMAPCIDSLLPKICSMLPSPLKLGSDKTTEHIEKLIPSQTTITEFDYLGYRFRRTAKPKKSKFEFHVAVSIAPHKIDRIAKRIDLSFAKFSEDSNIADLSGRIKLLTGNYKIRKSGHADPIPVGIYFNYRHITDSSSLMKLDAHLRTKLIALRTSGTLSISAKDAVKKLLKAKFTSGHNGQIRHRFSAKKIERFRKAWAYE